MNGDVLWKVPSVDHIFGSAILKDLDGELSTKCLLGEGLLNLWLLTEEQAKSSGSLIKKGGIKWYNFYNGQFIKDQDNDGVEDIQISNGGNVLAAPFDKKNRYPGYLVVLSAKMENFWPKHLCQMVTRFICP